MHDGQVSSVRPGPDREKTTFFRFVALTDGDATRTAADGVSKVWLDGKR